MQSIDNKLLNMIVKSTILNTLEVKYSGQGLYRMHFCSGLSPTGARREAILATKVRLPSLAVRGSWRRNQSLALFRRPRRGPHPSCCCQAGKEPARKDGRSALNYVTNDHVFCWPQGISCDDYAASNGAGLFGRAVHRLGDKSCRHGGNHRPLSRDTARRHPARRRGRAADSLRPSA